MWKVVIALCPGIAAEFVLFGFGVLFQIGIALITVAIVELIIARQGKSELFISLRDGTSIVLALIVGIAMPPAAEWWICVIAAAVASVFGKHLYGGTGQNLFNPAMVGVLFTLVCFPGMTSKWPTVMEDSDSQPVMVDAVSGATLLEYERTKLSMGEMRSEFGQHSSYGLIAEKGWEWVNVAFLLGGIWLCWQQVISVRIPLYYLATLFIASSIMHGFDPTRFAGPFIQIFSGAAILCAFFVATDPVSSPTGKLASIVYAVMLGLLVYVLRHLGAYPDSVAFSVVLMNALVPLLDRLLPRRIYGH